MKTIHVAFVFVCGVACCRAQAPMTNSRPLNFSVATPSQVDFYDAINQQDSLRTEQPAAIVPGGPSVSVARLRHKPPRKALAAFARGLKLGKTGQWQQGAQEFEQAVAIDRNFSEAHGNLGVAYSALGLFDRAALELRRAIELDPATGVHHMNYAYVLVRLKRENDAEPEARTAVALDPENVNAHYLLGYLFARRPGERQQAVPHLVYAAREVPEAHFVLAEVYLAQGATTDANQQLALFWKESAAKQPGSNAGGVKVKFGGLQ
jgi:tetratricopeptide (TPR) repeat protein